MRIPRTIDNPKRICYMPKDVAIVWGVVWLGVGQLLGSGFIGFVVGIFVANMHSKYRNRVMIRRLIRLIYWYLPCELNFIRGVQGHQRSFKLGRRNEKI